MGGGREKIYRVGGNDLGGGLSGWGIEGKKATRGHTHTHNIAARGKECKGL